MAREFAKIKAGIWQDDDFRALTPAAQHLYFVVLTDPNLSYCGIADWRPNRIAPKAAGWAVEEIEATARELHEARLFVIDTETEEVLVRSFLRHDGVMAHNKLCISACMAFAGVASNLLRGIIVHEMNRLAADFPDWPTWGREQVREVLKRNAIDPALAPELGAGLEAGVAPSVAPELGANPAPRLASALQQQQQQQHTTREPASDTAAEPTKGRKRPARALPQDWTPTPSHASKARELGVNLERAAESFKNHAKANDRRQADWNAAFSNWLLKERPTVTPINRGARPTSHDIHMAGWAYR